MAETGNMMASVTDLADFIGEPITESAEMKRAEMVLRFASMLVSEEARSEFTDGVPDKVGLIVLSCASRGFLNPESWANERIDDWGAGGRPVEELGMYLTGTEKRVLRGFRPSQVPLSTVATYRGDVPVSGTRYVPTAPVGDPQTPIPWW